MAKTKETKEKKTGYQKKYVSREDFENFKDSIVDILKDVVRNQQANKEEDRKVVTAGTTTEKTDPKSISEAPSNQKVINNLPPEYQVIFERYFDPEDGFKAMLKGISFKIDVPLKLSNAQDAYKDYYKVDIRHKVLDPHDIEGSMERYCKLVAQNLNYKRDVKLKI